MLVHRLPIRANSLPCVCRHTVSSSGPSPRRQACRSQLRFRPLHHLPQYVVLLLRPPPSSSSSSSSSSLAKLLLPALSKGGGTTSLLWSELALDLRPLMLPPRAPPGLLVRARSALMWAVGRRGVIWSIDAVPISIFFLDGTLMTIWTQRTTRG